MSINKGGRGHKAPYESTHVRVPLPIKDQVLELIEQYRVNGELTPSTDLSLDEAVKKATAILAQKKSAKLSMQKLLTSIYGIEVRL